MENWTRMRYQPGIPIGKDGKRVTSCEEHISYSKKVAGEGMVLLKNDAVLPLERGAKIAVFGKAQYDYVKGGGGSGDVFCKYIRNIYQGFQIKQDENKIKLYDGLYEWYKTNIEKQYAEGIKVGCAKELLITDEMVNEARKHADIAIITICRFSGESMDRTSEKGDFYLSQEEDALVSKVCKAFEKVAVVLDVGGIIDCLWFKDNDKIQAALLAWNAGMEGGAAIADIICGDINPSGKLVDTFANTFEDYPSSANFHESDDYVKYYEDIYVGYRYFETIPGANKKVAYPFGFGMSYTTFNIDVKAVYDDGKEIKAEVEVKNTGRYAGREVVQLYTSSPQGKLGKPQKELKDFQKTALLQPGESQSLTLSFAISSLASYDDIGKCQKSAWILEGGEYSVYIGTSVRDLKKAEYSYKVNEDFIVVEQLSEKVEPKELEKRMCADGAYEEMPPALYKKIVYKTGEPNKAEAPENTVTLADVRDKKADMDTFIAQLSVDQMISLLGGRPCVGLTTTSGMGAQNKETPELYKKFGIPCAMTADGPAGIRFRPATEVYTTAWPTATLIACTWDPELAYGVGQRGALEALENNMSIWLAPALNIHRTPLCGRNFEYYSEDPLISGKMAAAAVKGIQSENIAATIKHFACNNKETYRRRSNSILSERALREIYIKGFEICVKEAKPWCLMTSYNLVNGIYTSENYELITGILREEWGYDGVVCTDWYANGLHPMEIKAGNDIKMPVGHPASVKEALQLGIWGGGRLTRENIEESVKRLLELLIKLNGNTSSLAVDNEAEAFLK